MTDKETLIAKMKESRDSFNNQTTRGTIPTTGYCVPTVQPYVCPTCRTCPTCGRRGYHTYPYQPYYYNTANTQEIK